MQKHPLFYLLFAVCFLSLSSCGGRKETSVSRPVSKVVRMGDPEQIIEDTKLNYEIPEDVFTKLQSQQIMFDSSIDYVENKSYAANNIERNYESENAPAEDDSLEVTQPEYFQKYEYKLALKDSNWVLYTSNKDHYIQKFIFKKTNSGQFALDKMQLYDDEYFDGQLLHFSMSNDGRYMSLLVRDYISKKDGKAISAYYFELSPNITAPKKISSEYNYSLGKGLIYRWPTNKSVDIDMCTSYEPLYILAKKAVAKWSDALAGKLRINLRVPQVRYPPSDLNQHCIYFIDGYTAEPDPDSILWGITYTIKNLSKHEFIDGDILFFRNEFTKFDETYPSMTEKLFNRLKKTVTHELGHFLGLAHQFDKGIESVMSYKKGHDGELSDYDKNAIRALYSN